MEIDKLTYLVIGAAMRVHSHLGAGFLEEVYKNALFMELRNAGLKSEKEVALDVLYNGEKVGFYKADIVVEGRLILELKAVNALVPQNEAQLVNYLAATGIDDGLLLNFGSPSMQVKHKYRQPKSCES